MIGAQVDRLSRRCCLLVFPPRIASSCLCPEKGDLAAILGPNISGIQRQTPQFPLDFRGQQRDGLMRENNTGIRH
jgi:hypothetical protein